MSAPKNFVVFILTHGRPEQQDTLKSLERHGYTGPIVMIIDNEDKTADEYRRLYGDMVYQFDKRAVAKTFDEAGNFDDRRAIVYARNVCFEVAKELGYRYFLELDDDYTRFGYKCDGEGAYVDKPIESLDALFGMTLEFLKATPVSSIAWAQGGDFIGGKSGSRAKRLTLWRKCMNTFFCDVEKPFQFLGRINEDVNTYTCEGRRGLLLVTTSQLSINQRQTQTNKGGMTDIYKAAGTYIKSFYSVMFAPSCVTISEMGPVEKRLHHQVRWNNCVPKILDERHRKER